MNNEFTIMLIACLCTVTTIVVVMFINTTCAFQEKLDEQEKIIEREKIIHRQREEDHERKLLKKEVEYEKKLERAFALIETCNSKINELVLLNKESADKQQTENMIYCNKMHCQILARQDDESERCTELFQEIQTINIKHAEQAKIRSKSYITFCAIVPNFGERESIYPYLNNLKYGLLSQTNTYLYFGVYTIHMTKLIGTYINEIIHNEEILEIHSFTHKVVEDILDNIIFIFDNILSPAPYTNNGDLLKYNRASGRDLLNLFRMQNSSIKMTTLISDEIQHINPEVIPIGSVLSGEISKYFPENTYVVNYIKDAFYTDVTDRNPERGSPCSNHLRRLGGTAVILSNNRIKKYPVSLYEKEGDEVNLRNKCYIDGSFI